MRIIPINLNGDFSEALHEALVVLKKGGVVVFPTDTVYGIGANACDWYAVEQIFRIKRRPLTKPISVLVRNMNWVREIAFVPPKLEKVLEEIWPGATTVILPKKKVIPAIVTAKKKNVGIRIPDYAFTDKLLGKFGYPIAATSANISGEGTPVGIGEIIMAFGSEIWKPDLVLDAGVLPPSEPSTILDMTTIRPKITRVGPTKPEQLMRLLGM